MRIRQSISKKATAENMQYTDFCCWCIGQLDKEYNQNTQLIIKDNKNPTGGRTLEGNPIITLPPASVELFFAHGFTETRDRIWWKPPHNPKGYRAVFLLAIHEYAHTLFYKWLYHKKGIKPHSRQFIDICRSVCYNSNFEEMFKSWQASMEIDF